MFLPNSKWASKPVSVSELAERVGFERRRLLQTKQLPLESRALAATIRSPAWVKHRFSTERVGVGN